MIMSEREKKIGFATVIVLVVLLLDRFLLTPYLVKRDRLYSEQQNLEVELRNAGRTLAQWREMAPVWEDFLKLDKEAVGGAGSENETLNAIRNWAEQGGMLLSLLKPEGKNKKGELDESVFQVVGTGSMESISRFLWSVENVDFPVLKIKELQFASRREGIDNLTLQLRIGELHPASVLMPGGKAAAEVTAFGEEKEE